MSTLNTDPSQIALKRHFLNLQPSKNEASKTTFYYFHDWPFIMLAYFLSHTHDFSLGVFHLIIKYTSLSKDCLHQNQFLLFFYTANCSIPFQPYICIKNNP
ncbi:uncharacterized protein DS421_9g276860 [Arachis hypogaea]|nr:uncharacterized protein DS421_9g276860 [Arachis hypogaea]